MMRLAVLLTLVLAAGAAACNGEATPATPTIPPTPTAPSTRYEVTVQFVSPLNPNDLDEAEALLRAYDDEVELLIMESFPPTGRAILETSEAEFCATVEAELEAETYVEDASCQEWEELAQSGDPDEPVQSS